jgi:hypothetical protein
LLFLLLILRLPEGIGLWVDGSLGMTFESKRRSMRKRRI